MKDFIFDKNKISLEIKNKSEEKNNYIIGEIKIEKNDDLNQRIINSYENVKREEKDNYLLLYYIKAIENEKEIKDCEIYINDKKINFSYFYTFPKEGIYTIKYKFNKILHSTNFIFCECSSLFSLDFSNFNSANLINSKYMFYNCFSLTILNLSNFKSSNINNMEYIFYNCY